MFGVFRVEAAKLGLQGAGLGCLGLGSAWRTGT